MMVRSLQVPEQALSSGVSPTAPLPEYLWTRPGLTTAMRIGALESIVGCGGAVPVLFVSCVTTVSGTSVTLCALTFIPFLRPQASVSRQSTINFWPLGILDC